MTISPVYIPDKMRPGNPVSLVQHSNGRLECWCIEHEVPGDCGDVPQGEQCRCGRFNLGVVCSESGIDPSIPFAISQIS